MQAFGQTNIGAVRASNQDSFACGVFEDGAAWGIVCDGMGGANGGDVASSSSVAVAEKIITEGYFPDIKQNEIEKLFKDAADAANTEVFERAIKEPQLQGMGTTMVIAIVRRHHAYIMHVGDSRAYLIGKDPVQVTKDHSLVQDLVDRGRITKDEAENHPYKNVITRAIGVKESVETDFTKIRFGEKSRLLICSDGLSNLVSRDQLLEISESSTPEKLPERYISAANEAGGKDNITAVIICK